MGKKVKYESIDGAGGAGEVAGANGSGSGGGEVLDVAVVASALSVSHTGLCSPSAPLRLSKHCRSFKWLTGPRLSSILSTQV